MLNNTELQFKRKGLYKSCLEIFLKRHFDKLSSLKAEECVKTLNRYLENIIKFPEDDKYYKIRMSNRYVLFYKTYNYITDCI